MNLSHDERRAIHEWLVPLVGFVDDTEDYQAGKRAYWRVTTLLEAWYDSETVEDLIFEAETIAGVI